MNTALNIYEYLDFRQFLKDHYTHMKKIDSTFSYAVWAQKGSIKSRSFLRLITVGKRQLTDKMMPSIIRSLDLNKAESNYFGALVRFNQASSIEDRERYLQELKNCSNKKITQIYDTYTYLSSHWCPRIHVLLTLEDIDKTVEALAKMTKLSISKMEGILNILQKAGIANKNEDGAWYSKETIFQIPDELNNLAIQSFHKNSLEMAQESITTDPSERQYQSIFMPLSPGEYQELADEIDQTTTRLLKKFSSSTGKNKKLYQLNTNLIPVSSDLIHSLRKAEPRNASEMLEQNHSQEVTNENV